MAYALVGSAGTVSTAGTPAFGQATTAGNLLILWLATFAGTGITVNGTGWTVAPGGNGGSGNQFVDVYYKANSSAGESAPTITGTGLVSFSALAEFSGGATSGPGDVGSNNFGITSPVVSTNATVDISAGELLVSSCSALLSMSGTHTSSNTYNNGATPTTNLNNDSTSVTNHYRFAWGTTTGNSSATNDSYASDSMTISGLAVKIATFKLKVVQRNPAIDFKDPAFYMKKLDDAFRRHGRIFVPRLWLPDQRIAVA